uniref:Uncharacterized protein n=1 Tax=Nelumbo nucifera TaxID=4432 RepID=A0A822XSX1_NELNU|nr:TPA_asm: hypothetical protein HUJ06_023469 [Nelumbo nucifera]
MQYFQKCTNKMKIVAGKIESRERKKIKRRLASVFFTNFYGFSFHPVPPLFIVSKLEKMRSKLLMVSPIMFSLSPDNVSTSKRNNGGTRESDSYRNLHFAVCNLKMEELPLKFYFIQLSGPLASVVNLPIYLLELIIIEK